MSEAKSGAAVSTYTVIGTVDADGNAQPVDADTPLPVDSASVTVEQTDFTYDGDGNLTSYIENGTTWTLTYDSGGNLLSITGS